jgi:hypothetical protein
VDESLDEGLEVFLFHDGFGVEQAETQVYDPGSFIVAEDQLGIFCHKEILEERVDGHLAGVCLRDEDVDSCFGDVLALGYCQFGENNVGSFLVKAGDEPCKVLDCFDHVVGHFMVFDHPALQHCLHSQLGTIALMAS